MSNDTRGAIYAMFEFTQSILGVDPLYRFSGINGRFYENNEIIIPSDLSIIYKQPLFMYRGLFNNDEDLNGGWAKDPYGMAVHSATVYDWIFESTLRMKGNMMIVGMSLILDWFLYIYMFFFLVCAHSHNIFYFLFAVSQIGFYNFANSQSKNKLFFFAFQRVSVCVCFQQWVV